MGLGGGGPVPSKMQRSNSRATVPQTFPCSLLVKVKGALGTQKNTYKPWVKVSLGTVAHISKYVTFLAGYISDFHYC